MSESTEHNNHILANIKKKQYKTLIVYTNLLNSIILIQNIPVFVSHLKLLKIINKFIMTRTWSSITHQINL